MRRVDAILYRLRWPEVILSSLLMLGLIWWVLPTELFGAAGLVGVIGFLPVSFVGHVVYYLLALNFVTILLLAVRYMFPPAAPVAIHLAREQPASRSMVLTTGMMIGALLTGAALSIFEVLDIWANIVYSSEFTTMETHLFRAGPGMAIAMIGWAGSIVLLQRYWRRGDTMTQLALASQRLAIAAMLLLILAAIVHNHALKRDPDMIHQALGSYTGLVLGLTVLIWSLLVASVRHFFIADYHQARIAQQQWEDKPRPRGKMSLTFKLVYMCRQLAFAVISLTLAVVLWLMFTDIFIRIPMGSMTLRHLSITSGYWLLPEHGIRGMFGFYPASKLMHLMMSLFGVTLFLLSQYLFEKPWRSSLQSLTTAGRFSWANAAGIAIPAAGLTGGALAMAMEKIGRWSHAITAAGPVSDRRHFDIIFEPTFWIAMPVLVISFVFWMCLMRRLPLTGHLFYRRSQVLFTLFVVATTELFLAGMIQSISYGYGGQYWNRGTFTTMCVGASVTLWTCIPALRLIYAGQDYLALTAQIQNDPATKYASSQSQRDDVIVDD